MTGQETEVIDLRYDGRPGILGAWICGDVLIDCGPSACFEQLLEGLAGRTPRRLLLTHIHFDHAGAAGALLQRWPELEIYVHPVGAPHLTDPSRLLRSARRVFGDSFERLVGDVVAVPAERLHVIEDGERIGRFESAWTPGHASHHIAYLERDTGVAFPGDVAGVRLSRGPVFPPTPPPDIDLRAWRRSLRVLADWRPERLALPHYGSIEDVEAHLAELAEALDRHERWAAEGEEAFVARLAEHLRARIPAETAEAYEFIALARPSAAGLRRSIEQQRAGDAASGAA